MVKKALFFLILFALSVLFMLTKPTPHIWSYDKIQMQIPSNLEVHDTLYPILQVKLSLKLNHLISTWKG